MEKAHYPTSVICLTIMSRFYALFCCHLYIFGCYHLYGWEWGGGVGCLVSWLSCVYSVSGAMWVVQLGWNQSFNFRFKFFYKSAFYMISVEMH